MSTQRGKKQRREAKAARAPWKLQAGWMAGGTFLLAVLVFYWVPLTSSNASQQWDTIDVHYSLQRYAGEELRALRLPRWSEYSYSGFPFLADPQVGLWYPLNWPFFVAGVTPKALQWEIALHVLLAALGAWLLARQWLGDPRPAAVGAVLYAFSGFFAGHASHLGMLQTAAWLPLVLFGLHRSILGGRYRTMALTGAGCACLFLAGHFQTALYSFAALGVYGVAVAALEKRWKAAAAALAVMAALTVLLSAVQWLPTMELAGQSVRAGMSFREQTNAPLEPRAFWTLVSPNHYGSVRGNYSGPGDSTQFYFYAGLVLLPLAAVGMAAGRLRWAALALAAPFAWYALGPAGGLYRVITLLPGFASVRAPVHAWFVVALGLALAAAAGAGWLASRFKLRWLPLALAGVAFVDVLYWNSLENQLAYFRGSFESRYGDFQEAFDRAVRPALPQGTRFHAPFNSPSFGPQNGTYDLRLPVTFGYNPMALKRYADYFNAAARNPALLNGLNVGAMIIPASGNLVRNPSPAPRFFFPRNLTAVPAGQAAARLATANPVETALVEGDISALRQDPGAQATQESDYSVRCQAASPSLLRAAIPWYPAWRALVDGQPAPIYPVDHGLMGIPVPAGRHAVVLEYASGKFRLGAAISLITLLLVIVLGKALDKTRGGSGQAASLSVN